MIGRPELQVNTQHYRGRNPGERNLWKAVKKAIQDYDRFLLCTHRDPDADGVGSELALSAALKEMGKEPVILNPDTLPHVLRFLDPAGEVIGYDVLEREEALRLLDEAQAIFFLDASVWTRLHPMDQEVSQRAYKVLCIDHHPADQPLTPGSVVYERASSTGELIFDLLAELNHPVNDRVAFCLYTALVKDTGCFRYENTTSRVFEIAEQLARYDSVLPNEIYDWLFERSSVTGVICLGKVLETLDFAYGQRLAHISLTRRMIEQTGASRDETENYIDVIRSIDPVRVCLYFRELDGGKIKVSFRSKTKEIDVNTLAEKFGGGGHKRASGAVIAGRLADVVKRVVDQAAELFE